MPASKSSDGGQSCERFFYEYAQPTPGQGHLIHTYQGDGNPLPSFVGEPVRVALEGDFQHLANQLWQVLDEDIGSVEDVDEGMMRGCNHPMGPLALADMIGLDILLEVMETFYIDLGDTKYRPAHLLRKMVAAGYLGRKTGAGFYVYEKGKKVGVNPVLVKK